MNYSTSRNMLPFPFSMNNKAALVLQNSLSGTPPLTDSLSMQLPLTTLLLFTHAVVNFPRENNMAQYLNYGGTTIYDCLLELFTKRGRQPQMQTTTAKTPSEDRRFGQS